MSDDEDLVSGECTQCIFDCLDRRVRLYMVRQEVGVKMPARSLDQRLSALQRANEIRLGRSELKKELAAGSCRIDDLLAETPELARGAKVYDLLLAVPKLGRVRVSKLLRGCRISEAKTLGGLSERQRAELIASLRR